MEVCEILADESGDLNVAGFGFRVLNAIVADVGIGCDENLAKV
jgi:hypothetical protein